MIFSRALFRRAPWVSQPLAKSTRGSTLKDSLRRTVRRNYATEGEKKGPKPWLKTDWPWAIVSITITVPSVYILSQPQVRRWKERSEKKKKEKAAEKESSASSPGEEQKSGEHEQSKDGAPEDGKNATTSKDEVGENKEEEPESEEQGKKQGVASEPQQDPNDKDLAAASKPAGDVGNPTTQSAKQEGISNADTKHSTDLGKSEHSMKGEGIPETAKSKGTVDINRPQK